MAAAPLRVLVVDDERLARERVLSLLAMESDALVVGECANGLEALAAITSHRPDVVFLDVQMPELDGLGVVEALGGDDMPEVVFVTAHNTYMERAFELHAIDYLRKPYTDARFAAALAHARRRVHARRAERVVSIRSPAPADLAVEGNALRRARYSPLFADVHDYRAESRLAVQDARTGAWRIVDRDAVEWVRTDGPGRVRARVAGETQAWRKSISDIEQALDPRSYLRVHRSVIVNAKRVREVKPLQKGEYAITLADGTVFDSGRTYRAIIERFVEDLRADQ